jgi:hypothetical protein
MKVKRANRTGSLHVEDVAELCRRASLTTPSAGHIVPLGAEWLTKSGCAEPFGF